jgi:cyclopropane-fatty-acyl-phospholipid synthase
VGLKKGMHVLEIGCGYGSFMKYAAENYGVKVTGVSVSKEQIALGQKLCQGLDVEFVFEDYRKIQGQYDCVVSIAMFEAVGYKNFRTFMEVASRSLKDDGLFLLHTIANKITYLAPDPWINKYIFPNGLLPSLKQISESSEKLFVIEDVHNFGADYDKTLVEWCKNFEQNWDKIKNNFDERFYRMWKYYLLSCAGMFRSRNIELYQVIMSKKGVLGGYIPVR